MNRRNFLTTAALGVSAVGWSPSLALGVKSTMKKAIQLVSIIPSLNKNLPDAFYNLAKMGYQGVEVANRFTGLNGYKPSEFRKILDDNGLACTGATIAKSHLEGDNFKKTAEIFAELGGKYINQAELIVEKSEVHLRDAWLRVAEKYNLYSEQMKAFNLNIGVHNHVEEFTKTESGQTGWEIFFSITSKKIVHEIDVCHCIEGGGKPEEFINLFANRTKAIHIKEFPRNQVEAFPGFIPDPIPLGKGKYAIPFGKGQANWKDIFNACKNNGGTEWYIAEFYMGKEDEQRGQDMIVAKQMVDFLKSYQ